MFAHWKLFETVEKGEFMLTNVSVNFVSKGLLCTAGGTFVVPFSDLPNVCIHGNSIRLVKGHETGTVGHLNNGRHKGEIQRHFK